MGDPHGVGIVGLGVVSRQYLDTLARSSAVRIAAVADLDSRLAESVADALPDTRALTVDELMADPAVATVLNLTTPAAHADVALRAIAGGKDVFGEKPLAVTMAEATRVIDAATAAGRRVGSAPDTVLGTGVQTARSAIAAGVVGRPVSAVATWGSPGHELWHPNPDFYYRTGGGPVLDMGPYYVTSLVHLLGPVVAVVAAASRTRDARTIGSGPRAGESVAADVPTHVSGVLEHAGGAISTVTMSFDTVRSSAHPIEVHGEAGSLQVPDPNGFAGRVRLFPLGATRWRTLPVSAGYVGASRGIGLVDLIAGHGRASGALALHVLEVLTGLLDAAASGTRVRLRTTVAVPPIVPLDAGALATGALAAGALAAGALAAGALAASALDPDAPATGALAAGALAAGA